MTKEQFTKITEWQNKTFGQATAGSKIAHLADEISELYKAIHSELPPDKKAREKWLEFADCFILLFGAAASDGMCYEDIVDCVNEKMEINYTRKWGKPNDQGVVNHIKEGEQPS